MGFDLHKKLDINPAEYTREETAWLYEDGWDGFFLPSQASIQATEL